MPIVPESGNKFFDVNAKTPEMPENESDPFGVQAKEQEQLEYSAAVAKTKSFDEASKVFDVSRKVGIPVDYVADNLPEVEKEIDHGFDLKKFAHKSPSLAKWMAKSPTNFALIKDDHEVEEQLSNNINDYSMMSQFVDDFVISAAEMVGGAARTPEFAADMAALNVNIGAKLMGLPDRMKPSQMIDDNAVIKAAKKWRDDAFARNPYADQDMVEAFGKGDMDRVGRIALGMVARSAPQGLLMLLTRGFSIPILAVTTAASKSAALQEEGVDPLQAIPNAMATGGIEAATETLGSLKAIGKMANAVISAYGKQAGREVIKAFGKQLFANSLQEAGEEAIAALGEATADFVTGVNPNAFENISKDVVNQVAAGFIGGATMSSGMGGYTAIQSFRHKKHADQQKAMSAGFQDAIKASKLYNTNVAAWQEKAEAQLEGTNAEHIYMPVEHFEVLAQSEYEGGVHKAVADLTEGNSYSNAKNGVGDGYVKMKTAKFLAASKDNYLFQKSIGDITYDPTKPTPNQQEQAKKEINEQFTQAMSEAQRIAKESGEDISLDGDSVSRMFLRGEMGAKDGKTIEEQIYENLLAAGKSKTEARVNSIVFGKAMLGFARMSGKTLEDVLSRVGGLNIKSIRSRDIVKEIQNYNKQPPKKILPTTREVFFPAIKAIRSGLQAPTPKGDSMLQAIRKMGGIRDVDANLPKTIKRSAGKTLDQVRAGLIEQGYIGEESTNEDVLRLIESEAGGSPVFSASSLASLAEETSLYEEQGRLARQIKNAGFDLEKLESQARQIRDEIKQLRSLPMSKVNQEKLQDAESRLEKITIEQAKENDALLELIQDGGLKDETPEQEQPEGTLFQSRPTSDVGHKREKSTGRYVGAPDWVGKSPQKLVQLRKKLKQLALEGEAGRYWYENSSRAILEAVNGDKVEAEKLVSLLAIFSPNATVSANTTMALTAWYQHKAGLPIAAGTSVNNEKAEQLLGKGEAWKGIKTTSFYQNLMVEIDPSKLDEGVATMDMWMAIAFDYGMKTLDQGSKYKFAEREIQNLAAELGWKAHQVQAAIWVAMKGRTEATKDELQEEELKAGIGEFVTKKNKDGKLVESYQYKSSKKYEHFRLAHKVAMARDIKEEAIKTAKYDFSNAIQERAAQISWESTPSKTVGAISGIHSAPTSLKLEYLAETAKVLTKDGKDQIAELVGLPYGQTIFGISAFEGDIGSGAQTFVPVPSEGAKNKRKIKAPAKKIIDLYAAARGFVLEQDSVCWHIPVYDEADKNKNGIDLVTSRALTESEMRLLYDALYNKFNDWGIAPGYTENGARILTFVDGLSNKDFHKGFEEILEILPDDFGGGVLVAKKYRSDGEMIQNDWKENKNGEGYKTHISDAGRSDILAGLEILQADVKAVQQRFIDKYGWDKPFNERTEEQQRREEEARATKEEVSLSRPESSRKARPLFDEGSVLFQSASKQLAERDQLGFYYKSEQIVLDKMGSSATAEQVRGMLKEVKPEELEWLGINEFLKGKEKVSKQELLDLIRANDLQITEKTLGNVAGKVTSDDIESHRIVHDEHIFTFFGGESVEFEFERSRDGEDYDEAIQIAVELMNDRISEGDAKSPNDDTRYGEHTLPNGENYREVLFTLPDKSSNRPQFSDWMKSKGYSNDLYLIKMLEYQSEFPPKDKLNYSSPHFKEPNILAHTRLNDRVDEDGKRVLFVEEIQSDWHQQGRTRGYRGEFEKTKKEFVDFLKSKGEHDPAIDISYSGLEAAGASPEMLSRFEKVMSRINGTPVPDAPLKKTWHEFVLKRIIRMAAEQGYDRVAWTTGEQQAERYDLSKQIGSIIIGKNNNGGFDVMAYKDAESNRRGRNPLIEKTGISKNELADTIGKELADRADKELELSTSKNYEGLDLKVGGEGMKGFYDKIIVDSVNKLVKKFGVKANTTRVSASKEYVRMGSVGENGSSFYVEIDGDREYFDTEQAANNRRQEILSPKTVHSLDINDDLRAAAVGGFELFQGMPEGKRGAFIKKKFNGFFNIFFLEKANATTFMHESAHLFLELMQELAADESSSAVIKEELVKVRKYLGNAGGEFTDAQHEKFAESFEKYLYKGQSPSRDLEGVMKMMHDWFLWCYKFAKDIYPNVKLSPEITDFFDKLLATESEIAEQKANNQIKPMFLDGGKGLLSEDQRQLYVSAMAREEHHALNRFRAENLRQLTRDQKEKRAALKEQITPEIRAQVLSEPLQKIYAAILDKNLRIDRKEAIKLIGAEAVAKLPQGVIKNGGMSADQIAGIVGFEGTAAEMLLQMSQMETPSKKIDRLVNERLDVEFPDPTKDFDFASRALDALHNEAGTERRIIELNAFMQNEPAAAKMLISKIFGRRQFTPKFFADQAYQVLSQMRMKEIKPHYFKRLELQWAQSAMKEFRNGNFEAAIHAKTQEIINYELYRQAVKVREEFERSLGRFDRAFEKDEKLAKSRDMDLVNAARAILAGVGLGSTKKTPDQYLNALEKYSDDQERIGMIRALATAANIESKDLMSATYAEFQAVKKAFDGIWDLAREEKSILINDKRLDLDWTIAELRQATQERLAEMGTPEFNKKIGLIANTKTFLQSYAAASSRVQAFCMRMDGGNPNGKWHQYFWNRAKDAETEYAAQKEAFYKRISEHFKKFEHLFKNEVAIQTRLGGIPKQGRKVSEYHVFHGMRELLGALLHIGNDSNKLKLIVGNGWGSVDENGVLDSSLWDEHMKQWIADGTLTKDHFDFVQGIWDMMESLKPAAQQAHKRINGYYFGEITAQEIVTPFGVYRGGYAPAARDMTKIADNDKDAKSIGEGVIGNLPPQKMDGHTKVRLAHYAKPLVMDLNLFTRHVDTVLKFSYITPAVQDMKKIVFSSEFRSDLDNISDGLVEHMLKPWLDRVARHSTTSRGGNPAVNAVANVLRERGGYHRMFLNLINALQQVTGTLVGAAEIEPRFLAAAHAAYLKNPKQMTREIAEMSEFMRLRQDNQMREAIDEVNDIMTNPNLFQKQSSWATKHAYVLQQAMQNIVDSIVFRGAYEQAISENYDHETAVGIAENAVNITQGSTTPSSISAIEASSPAMKLFLQFTGYFNNLINLSSAKVENLLRSQLGLKEKAMRGAYLYLMVLALPFAFAKAIVLLGSGDDLLDDDEDIYDDLLMYLFGEPFKGLATGIPLLGVFLNVGIGQMTDSVWDDRLALASGQSMLESMAKVPGDVVEIIEKEKIKKEHVRDIMTLLSIATKNPVFGAASRPLSYMIDVQDGRKNPEGVIDMTRGLVVGK